MPRKPMPIRDLFVNTGERSAGSAVPIWACRRCGWKLVDNATRFARHVLRCPSTQPGDRDLAQEHLASLGGTSTAQLEAISANADEFGRAFTLEGKAQIRNLFEDTQLRRSGEKAKLFRCKRCGHETTENATRFAQHILKCEEATTQDRAVASEHQQLTAKRREMRQAKHGWPGGVAVKAEVREAREGPNSSSSVPSTEKAGSAGWLGSSTSINGSVDDTGSQDVVSEGAGSASRSTSQSSLAPAEAPEVKAEAPPGLQEAQGGGGGGVPSEPPCTVLHINSQPALGDSLLRDSNHDIINLDLLDCFVDDGFEEELARLQQPSFMNGPSGGDTARGTSGTAFQSRSRAPSGEMAFGHSIPNRDHSYAQPSHRHTANQSYLQQADPVSSGTYSHAQPPQHMAHPATNPHVSQPPQHHQASPAFANLQPSHDEFHANRNLSQPSNTSVSFEEIEDLLPSLRMLPTSNNASHDGRGNECTALSPVFHKRQRDNRGESLPAETVSISFDEYQQWKQWKEQVERPKIIQVPDMEYTMFQNLYSFFMSHAMNCANVYIAHGRFLGPSCNTAMIAQAISKDWAGLASVYKTMVTCCGKAQARFVLEKAGTCPERVAAIYNSTLAIAQDCLNTGIKGALDKWSQFSHLDKNQVAAYQGLEKAFQHMTLDDDGTRHAPDPKSEGVIISLQQFTVRYGPYLRDLYLCSSKNNQLAAGSSNSTCDTHQTSQGPQFTGSVPPQQQRRSGMGGGPDQDALAISQGEFTNWHQQATEFSPLMDEIANDVRTSIAVTSYMTELYSVAGWDLVLII